MLLAINRKLLRDLWQIKGQVLSIALVIACGVALLVMAFSTYESLRLTTDTYYERYRFGHVFSHVKRAPLHLESDILAIDGVQRVQLRISMQAILDVEGFAEPLTGRLISVPEGEQPDVNQLVLQRGRLVEPGRPDEVVINESFARAHELHPGDSLFAIINNKKRHLKIVGTAMSPEFIYVISPFALMPDRTRYGILWMGREALEAAYDYDGAFNDLSLTLMRGADSRAVINTLDSLLEKYGSLGAIDRSDHLSNWFVQNELEQNRASAQILPVVFMAVAAFLTNMLLTRLIAIQRSEIGLLKAFGYSNAQVGYQYVKFVLAVTAIGIVLGWVMGARLGQLTTQSYVDTLNLPFLVYRPGPNSFLAGALLSLIVALLAALRGVLMAARLSPVVAMNPPQPPSFRRGNGWMRNLGRGLDEPTRIIFRQISRWPLRAMLTTFGFAGAVAMMVFSLQFFDAVDEIAASHFGQLQRGHIAIGFTEPKAVTVLHDVRRMPGVMLAETMRIVSADFEAGQYRHRGAVQGIERGSQLTRVFDVNRGLLALPENGIIISRKLAQKLRVREGDQIQLSILEGKRPKASVQVVAVFDSYIGMFAYMNIGSLNRLMAERPLTEYISLFIDKAKEGELIDRLKDTPAVSNLSLHTVALANFHQSVANMLMIFVGFFTAFSFALGFGVAYNAARISLSERARELATLRVLGFSRHDALYILFGETFLLLLPALPLGCGFGFLLTRFFVNASGFQNELIRLPIVIQPSTYGLSVLVMLLACLVCALLIKRRVDQLDLVAVLKTRE